MFMSENNFINEKLWNKIKKIKSILSFFGNSQILRLVLIVFVHKLHFNSELYYGKLWFYNELANF